MTKPTTKLVLLRHGESLWNRENRFTGWTDVGLTPQGEHEAREAGRLMTAAGLDFDLAHTSVLKRAIKTLWLALEEMDRMWLPVAHSWRLNERHYGALQGLNKAEMAAKFGERQVLEWRRSYDVPPPPLAPDDPRSAAGDPRYRDLAPDEVPRTECLKDTVARFLPHWNGTIAPAVRDGQRVLITAHGNSLRALVKHLDGISDTEIVKLNIPTGVPLVYELDPALRPIRNYYLGDQAAIEAKVRAVAAQGESRDLSRFAARLAVAALVAAGSVAAQQPREEDLRELRARIDRLKQELAASEGARAEAADELRDSETAISEANRRLAELAVERDQARAAGAKIAVEAAALRRDLEARQGALARLLYARYTEGERGMARTLLSGDDPQALARRLVYQGYLSREQGEVIARARTDLARLAALETGAREQAAALVAVETRARAERDTLRAKAAERRQVIARTGDRIRKARTDLSAAQQNEARLARLVQELARAMRPAPRPGAMRPEPVPGLPTAGAPAGSFGAMRGRLRPPVQGELSARFGAQQQAASPSPKGVFFRTPEGGGVRAVAGGRVVFADWMRGYGNLLIVDHGDDFLSIYGNNEAVLKRVGDAVHAGDVVATVGASGGNEAAGLYFELRHQGKAFDPVPWLQSR